MKPRLSKKRRLILETVVRLEATHGHWVVRKAILKTLAKKGYDKDAVGKMTYNACTAEVAHLVWAEHDDDKDGAFTVTPAGHKALETEDDLTPTDQDILTALAKNGPLPRAKLVEVGANAKILGAGSKEGFGIQGGGLLGRGLIHIVKPQSESEGQLWYEITQAGREALEAEDASNPGIERDQDLPWGLKKVAVFKALKGLGAVGAGNARNSKEIATKAGLSTRDVRHYVYHARAAGLTGVNIEGTAGYSYYLTAKGSCSGPGK